MKVGVIGLGNIGGGVARSLIRAGRRITVFDVAPKALESFRDTADLASSPEQLARETDIIFIAVFSGDQVRDVLFGADGIAAAGRKGQIVGVQSTVSLKSLLDWEAQCRSVGLTLVDLAVTGGAPAAEAGTLTTMVGATEADFERVKPVLDDFNGAVLHFGPVGSGISAKVALNLTGHLLIGTAYEASTLAVAAGIDVAKLQDAMRLRDEAMGGLRGYFKWMTDGSYLGDTPQSIQRARHTALTTHKDLQAALELADSLGVDLPIARLVEERADSFVEIDPQSGERRRPKRVPAVSS